MRILRLTFLALACAACSSAEPARPYAPEIDPASPRAQEPDDQLPPDPLKQLVVPRASAQPKSAPKHEEHPR